VRLAASPTYHREAEIPVDGSDAFDQLRFDPVARRLYLARANRVQVIDVNKGRPVREVKTDAVAHTALAVPGTGRGYVSVGDSSIAVFDLETLAVVGKIRTFGLGPDMMHLDEATRRLFVFNAKSPDGTVVDVRQPSRVPRPLALGGLGESAVSDGRGRMFVSMKDRNSIAVVDAAALTVQHEWSLPCKRPHGLSIDPHRRRLFVSCQDRVAVVDAESGIVLATLAAQGLADQNAFDPRTRLLFNPGTDTLTVFAEGDGATFGTVQKIPTLRGSMQVALDSITHRVYLTGIHESADTTAQGVPIRHLVVLVLAPERVPFP
jgi:DNA-binding beta-propeller fold protein YncE